MGKFRSYMYIIGAYFVTLSVSCYIIGKFGVTLSIDVALSGVVSLLTNVHVHNMYAAVTTK